MKEERRAAKRGEVRTSKGPEIAWDEAVHAVDSDLESPAPEPDQPELQPEAAPPAPAEPPRRR